MWVREGSGAYRVSRSTMCRLVRLGIMFKLINVYPNNFMINMSRRKCFDKNDQEGPKKFCSTKNNYILHDSSWSKFKNFYC